MPRNRKNMMAPRAKFDVLYLCVLLQEILILLQGKNYGHPLSVKPHLDRKFPILLIFFHCAVIFSMFVSTF